MSLESTASTARTGTKSLRATIPEGIVAFLDLKTGDSLEWKMDVIKDKKIVIVSKKKGKQKK